MANAVRYIDLLRQYELEQDDLARQAMKGGTYESYWLNVGKYRQLESLISKTKGKLDKGGGMNDEDFDDPQDTREQSEAEPVIQKSNQPRGPRARSWGGR